LKQPKSCNQFQMVDDSVQLWLLNGSCILSFCSSFPVGLWIHFFPPVLILNEVCNHLWHILCWSSVKCFISLLPNKAKLLISGRNEHLSPSTLPGSVPLGHLLCLFTLMLLTEFDFSYRFIFSALLHIVLTLSFV
jgi:hypothetical protein